MAADKKTAFLGNMANQRRDIVAIMARMGDVIKSPQASYETRRWKEPQPLDFRVNDGGKAAARKKTIELENKKLSEEIYHILTEDRSRRTVEFNPGWRISKGGKVVIDCYETQRFGAKEYGALHGRAQAVKREMRERKKSDDVLRRNIAKLQSEYRAEGLLRDYQDKRELYDKTPRFPATLLHLDLVGAKKGSPVSSRKAAAKKAKTALFTQPAEWDGRCVGSGSGADVLAGRDAVYGRYQASIENKAYYAQQIAMANVLTRAVRVNEDYLELAAGATGRRSPVFANDASAINSRAGSLEAMPLPRLQQLAGNKRELQRSACSARPSSALPRSSSRRAQSNDQSSRPPESLGDSGRCKKGVYEAYDVSEDFLLPRVTETRARPKSAGALLIGSRPSKNIRANPVSRSTRVQEPAVAAGDGHVGGDDEYGAFLREALDLNCGESATGSGLLTLPGDCCGRQDELRLGCEADPPSVFPSPTQSVERSALSADDLFIDLSALTCRKMLLGKFSVPCFEPPDAGERVVGRLTLSISDFGYIVPRTLLPASENADVAADYVLASVGFVFEAESPQVDADYLESVGCETIHCTESLEFIDIPAALDAFDAWGRGGEGAAAFDSMVSSLRGLQRVADSLFESLHDLVADRPAEEQALCVALLRLVRMRLRRTPEGVGAVVEVRKQPPVGGRSVKL